MGTLRIDGASLEVEMIRAAGEAAPTIVFLHEGLGSIGQWRDFPQVLAQAGECNALAYARRGHGNSDPRAGPNAPEFMHVEALRVLPQLLRRLQIERPILFGHSDGASIALIHAGGGHAVRGVIAEAPHVFVEERSIEGITAARTAYSGSDLRQKLTRYHADVDGMFRGWNEIWLSKDFRDWNITASLAGIHCPVLAIQGEDDAYGTMAQLDVIAARVPAEVTLLKLVRCGHAPHREQPEKTLQAAARFIRQLPQ